MLVYLFVWIAIIFSCGYKTFTAAENYRYPDKKVDQHLKEIPLKDGVNDHIMDAFRYLLVNLIPIKQKAAGTIPW